MKKTLRLYATILMIAISLVGCNEQSDNPIKNNDAPRIKDVSRTIMIYIVGSDLESGSGAATNSIEQMLISGVDLQHNNILIQTGGTSRWENDIPNDKNMIFEIDDNELKAVSERQAENMASPETLTTFLSYCYDNYKTDSYSLILWDHGGGPIYGYGYDELFQDVLSLEDMHTALKDSPFGLNNKLEFIGFDACFMSSIEVAFAFGEYADYLIASQETSPGWGWDYSFLGAVTPSNTTQEIAVNIINTYIDYCNTMFDEFPRTYTDITLSCLDLTHIPNVAKGLDILYEKVYDSLDAYSFPATALTRNSVKEFGNMNTGTRSYDLVDLTHLNDLMSSDYAEQSKLLDDALNKLIVYNKANVDNANGVSIYYPYKAGVEIGNLTSMYKSIDFSGGYSNYIQKFTELKNGRQFGNWDLSSSDVVQAPGLTFSMQLTPEQIKTYAKANYYVLAQGDDGAYYRMFVSWDVTLSDDGKLTANYNGKTQKIVDKEKNETLFCTVIERERTDSHIRYHIPVIVEYINADRDPIFEIDNGFLQIQTDENGNNARLLSVVPMDEHSFSLAPKQLIDIYYYEIAMFPFYGKNPAYYTDGSIKPYEEWESIDSVSFYDMLLNRETQDSIGFELMDLDISDELFLMFHVYDVQGNIAASNLMPIDFGYDE